MSDGFFIDKNNVPSKPVLIYGDETAFRRDAAAAKRRARGNIQMCSTAKRAIVTPEFWWFNEEIWDV